MPGELELVRSVFRHHLEVPTAILFGFRAKGTHTERSDVYLMATGDVDPLRAKSIAAELEELPLPCRFEVQAMDQIHPHRPNRHHRVGRPQMFKLHEKLSRFARGRRRK